MKIKIGDNIPNSEFYFLEDDGSVQKRSSIELVGKGKSILFGLPGAYTATCSAKHLPGYLNNYELAQKKGITKIICLSVNDPFVMKAWGEKNNVGNKIIMAADPFCNFTKAIGAEIDRSARGLGIRSARYSMLIEEGVLKNIKVEEDAGLCEISGAANFLNSI
jgi:peroxiredoxin